LIDYSELKRLAEEATPGHRSVDKDVHGELHVVVDGLDLATVGVTTDINPSADADFIAAASPAAVLAMIGEIERLELEPAKHARRLIDQLKAELEALRKAVHGESEDLSTGIHGENRDLSTIEALRKDAERYRWLRDSSEAFHSFYLSTPIWLAGAKFSRENVDSSIDAALSKEPGQ
jgi:hypothetical protein